MIQEYLLTFEEEKDGQELRVHGNPDGLRFLAHYLTRLADKIDSDRTPDHFHLFTEASGTGELLGNAQAVNGDSKLFNYVTVMGWPTIDGVEPYREA